MTLVAWCGESTPVGEVGADSSAAGASSGTWDKSRCGAITVLRKLPFRGSFILQSTVGIGWTLFSTLNFGSIDNGKHLAQKTYKRSEAIFSDSTKFISNFRIICEASECKIWSKCVTFGGSKIRDPALGR
uniref:Uncharacterized protein n=1 Tax=Romanomermis culicivorax TaxID=13658 RepID=A0A915KGT1_ROMCU